MSTLARVREKELYKYTYIRKTKEERNGKRGKDSREYKPREYK
jgi:hypothetical protein